MRCYQMTDLTPVVQSAKVGVMSSVTAILNELLLASVGR